MPDHKIHRVFEKPADATWNHENYTEEQRQIYDDYITNVINTYPGYIQNSFVRDISNSTEMKHSYSFTTEQAAKQFLRTILDPENTYYQAVLNITGSKVAYKIVSYYENTEGDVTPFGKVIREDGPEIIT